MKKSKSLKLIYSSLNGFMTPSSCVKNVSFDNAPKLMDSSEVKEIVDLDPTIISTESVSKGNKSYTQDKLLVGNEEVTVTDTYRQIVDKKEIKTKFMGIYSSNVTAHNVAQNLEDKEHSIKENIENQDGDYQYRVVVNNLDVSNNDIVVETNSSLEATREVLKSLAPGSKITGVKEGIKESIVSQHVNGLANDIDSANKIISTIRGNSDHDNVVDTITPVRNKDKDIVSGTTIIVNSKKKANELINQSVDNDKEQITVSSEKFEEEKNISLTPKNVKTKEEAEKYLNQMISEGYNVVSRSIKPLFISRKINEVYDDEKDAKNRKDELESLYPGHEIVIKPERDITKDSSTSEIDEHVYQTKEEALEMVSDLTSDTVHYEVFKGNKLEMLTMDSEYFKSPEMAMVRVEEIRKKSVPGIPIHYSITKFDKSYYALSVAYYAYVDFYQIEVIKKILGYKYRVIGEIPKVDSYRVEVEAKKAVPRYKITKTINTKGYDYQYDVKYNKKVYSPTYTVSSVTPMYQLLVKGKGSYETVKTYNKVRKNVTPIYKFDTKINDLEIGNNSKHLEKSKVKILEKAA